jgi:Nucleolar pre-ribosomal-associated protein 1
LYADQCRWGDAERRDVSQSGWDWLIESIDIKRVYATIENFPVNDVVCLQYSFASNTNYEEVFKEQALVEAYSPGFLLPLILGALQDDVNNQSLEPKATLQGPLFVQRICEKGALSLALGALASKCSTIRRISVSILYHLMVAVDRPQSRNSSLWPCRKQMEMLLNAVQRSLILKHCDDHNSCAAAELNVPAIPGFSAIFLAKASFVLARPNDSLSPCINRAFLRSESDAGAFQDLTRLPAFIALFCSSADTSDLSTERKFALNLVKDGFTESTSYKLLTQCHCPELVLTAIEFALVRSSFGFDDELQILFATLTKVMKGGAEQVASHLVNRLGLVSWVRAFLVDTVTFPSAQARLAFLVMIAELFKLARSPESLMSVEDFVVATTGVAQAILFIALDHSYGERSTSKVATVVDPVLRETCDILFQLSQCQNAADSNALNNDGCQTYCRSDGIHPRSAVRFISELSSHPQLIQKAVTSFCVLPIRIEKEDTSPARQMCQVLLHNCRSFHDFSTESKIVLLRRVSFFLLNVYANIEKRNGILLSLLSWRNEFIGIPKLRHEWYACLKTLTPPGRKENVDLLSSSSNEAFWPLWILQYENDQFEVH